MEMNQYDLIELGYTELVNTAGGSDVPTGLIMAVGESYIRFKCLLEGLDNFRKI